MSFETGVGAKQIVDLVHHYKDEDRTEWKVMFEPEDFPLRWDGEKRRWVTARGRDTVEVSVED